MALEIILCIVAGYLCGTISTGYIVGKVQSIDIRKYGSGNAGTTNAFRTMGKKAGFTTFAGDFFKSFIPIMLMKYLIFSDVPYAKLLMMIFGFACVIGHNYPVWLKFKGGKGIAATCGVFVAIDPWLFIPGLITFLGLILLTKYVSVGSLCLATLFSVWMIVVSREDLYYPFIIVISICFWLSAVIRHRANIVRLINGNENKVGQRAKIEK